MKLIAKLLITALALLFVAEFLPGVTVSGFYIAVITAVLLGFVNVTLRPILVMLTLPINILTLGLFIFVINALLLLFIASFVEGFAIAGFGTAFVATLVISAISYLGDKFVETVS